jgi:hypothetical protein
MRYGEIKDTLIANGYELEYFQTSGELDMLTFNHPTIEGGINVDFVYSTDGIPQEVIDGKEFNYDDDWVRDIVVNSIHFERNMSISYMTDGVIDICGSSEENIIFLHGDDIDRLFHTVMSLIIDPEAMLNFQLIYNVKIQYFINEINRFLPALKKQNLKLTINRTTGNDVTLFSSLSYNFSLKQNYCVSFTFVPLSWEMKIYLGVKLGYLSDDEILPITTPTYKFKVLLDAQCNEFKNDWECLIQQNK